MSDVLVIYHGNCTDGFGSAWVANRALKDRDGFTEFFPGVHNVPPPYSSALGKAVLILDFSYQPGPFSQLANVAKSVTVIDHHDTAEINLHAYKTTKEHTRERAEELVADPGSLRRTKAYFDNTRSGVGLTWEAFFPEEPMPDLLRCIEDRDLWRFDIPYSRAATEALYTYPFEFAVWDSLMDEEALPDLCTEGGTILRAKQSMISRLLPCTVFMPIDGTLIPALNLPPDAASEAGDIMGAEFPEFPMTATYYDTAKFRVFSLRTMIDGVHCGKAAAVYGGGGHAGAAGFRVPHGHPLSVIS